MARHLAPFSCRQTMAEIVRRRSWGGVLPLGRHVSISGSSFIQCASASITPPHPGGAKCYPGAEIQGRTGSKARVSQYVQRGLPVLPSGKLDREQALYWIKSH